MTAQSLSDFTQAGIHVQQACDEVHQQFQLIDNFQQIVNQLTQISEHWLIWSPK